MPVLVGRLVLHQKRFKLHTQGRPGRRSKTAFYSLNIKADALEAVDNNIEIENDEAFTEVEGGAYVYEIFCSDKIEVP